MYQYSYQSITGSPNDLLVELSRNDYKILSDRNHFFFNTESWIRAWLSSLPSTQEMCLIRIKSSHYDSLIGLAIFGIRTARRLGQPCRQWHLFRTGDPIYDQVWTEYNDIPLLPFYSNAKVELFDYLASHTDATEVHVGVYQDNAKSASKSITEALDTPLFFSECPLKWAQRTIVREVSPYYDSTLSDERQQRTIKKQIRGLVVSGAVIKEELPADAFDVLMKTSEWHREKWFNTSTPSGFDNAVFVHFHRTLWSEKLTLSDTRPRLFSLFIGERRIATLYGFQQRDWFGFYCLCQDPTLPNNFRAGWFMHHHLQILLENEGNRYYDFMAGDDLYKIALSNRKRMAVQSVFFKKTLINKIYLGLVALKHVIKARLK